MLLNCDVREDSWESLGLQGDPTSTSQRRSVLGVHWKDWCWSWNSNILATWCEELTQLKRLWCWEKLRARGEGDDRGWDGWMASPTRWTWVWVDSGSWWWTGRPGVLWFMRSQRVGHDWATELNWTEESLMTRESVHALMWSDATPCTQFDYWKIYVKILRENISRWQLWGSGTISIIFPLSFYYFSVFFQTSKIHISFITGKNIPFYILV